MMAMLCGLAVAFSGAADEGWVSLLDSMDPWERVGGTDESFRLREGELTLQKTGQEPSELLTRIDYENFELTFEFRVTSWTASGLFIHAPRNRAYRAGLEFELSGHPSERGSVYSTGALFRHAAPLADPAKEPGEWNACRIEVDWPRLRAHINDVLVQDLDLTAVEGLRHALRRGALGFQNAGQGTMTVRDLRLRTLPDSEKGLRMIPENGLDGWSVMDGEATWQVQDGVLRSADGNGHLRHEGIFGDFDLRVYFRTSATTTNGGVYFRWPPEGQPGYGQEVQIYDVIASVMPTGSLYGIARAEDSLIRPGEWMLLQISARGPHVTTRIDGMKAVETDQVVKTEPGHIVLQMHSEGWIEYKDMTLVPVE